jgi:LDH2 family malate/lactate/ureidoglycolate dehydrogenase
VDNAFHYLWGGGYVMDAAKKGYIAYTNCTSTLGEVVPFGGKFPVLGTNPHSWGLPTQDACGFPIVIDWATSTVAMGRVQQLKREGKPLPPGAAVDARLAIRRRMRMKPRGCCPSVLTKATASRCSSKSWAA